MALLWLSFAGTIWAVVAGTFVFALWPSKRHRPHLPRLGGDPGLFYMKVWPARINFLWKGQKMVFDRYAEDKNANYLVHTLMADQIMLSPKYLPELRMLPESSLNATAALVDSVLGHFSGVDILLKDHLGSDICRAQLTKNLANIVPQMRDELNKATADIIDSPGPQPLVAFKVMYSLVSRISSRVFVGAPTCLDKEWTEPVEAFPIDVEKTKLVLLAMPSFLRPLLVHLLPMRWRLTRNRQRVKNLLFPSSRLQKSKEEFTVLNFLLQSSKDTDTETLTSRIILLTAAAFHNSSTALLQSVFDLCARPESISVLRGEAEQVLKQTNGVLSLEAVNNLHHLDSFLKESQRLNALSFLGFNRKVMSEVTLSNGTIITPGNTIHMPAGPMSHDPQYYDDADTFDPDRFCRQQTQDRKAQQQQESGKKYSEIEPGNLTWGNGRFSCPGRWYASVMIKMLLVTLLMDYDFELVGIPSGQRPQNWVMDIRSLPSLSQKIAFKKRARSL